MKPEDTKAKILEKALELFSENGYDGMFTIEVYSQNYSDRSEIIDSYKKLSRLFERK